jgi:hypothetical protein
MGYVVEWGVHAIAICKGYAKARESKKINDVGQMEIINSRNVSLALQICHKQAKEITKM